VLLSVPMGIMSYAFRGDLLHGPDGPSSSPINSIQGGGVTSLEYKFASLSIVGLIVSVALVFFVSEPSWPEKAHEEALKQGY
jgi:hypothetical protein